MTTDPDIDLIQNVFDAINDQDWNRYADCHTDEFVIHGWETDIELEAWVDSMRDTTLRAFPDLHYHIDELFAADDRVVMRYHVTGTHEAEYKGAEASGNEVSYPGIAVFRVEDGAVAAVWPVYDSGVLLDQIGVVRS